MALNTDFMLRLKFAKFVLKYIDYYGCASFDDRMKNGKIRKLGDLEEKIYYERNCQGILVPKNIPVADRDRIAKVDDDDRLYTSAGLEKLFNLFYQGRLQTENAHSLPRVAKVTKGKSKSAPKRDHYISKLTKEFVHLINDENFIGTVKQLEGLTQVLGVMWHPTRPLESVGQYAVAKHASIHYILSTHAILPSAECFTPEDIQRIMHLPIEWIGALPRDEDTRCITKFIAQFAELFARKAAQTDQEEEDPLDRHARRCGQRVFLDIIRFACEGITPQRRSKRSFQPYQSIKKESSKSECDSYEFENCPPLDWNDQLTRRNVKIVPLPAIEGTVEPVQNRFLRPAKHRYVQQNHVLFVSADEENVMKEANQIMTNIKVSANKEPQGLRRFPISRALKRAATKIECRPMHDFHKREVVSVPDQIAREERIFQSIVSNLPHHAYSIHRLEAINASVLAGLKPVRFNTSWLKDPVTTRNRSTWSATTSIDQWDPNRRIYQENLLRMHNEPVESPIRRLSTPKLRSFGKKLQSKSGMQSLRQDRNRSEVRRSTLSVTGRFSQTGQRHSAGIGVSTVTSMPEYMMTASTATGQYNVSNKIAHPFLPPINTKTNSIVRKTPDLTANVLPLSQFERSVQR